MSFDDYVKALRDLFGSKHVDLDNLTKVIECAEARIKAELNRLSQ